MNWQPKLGHQRRRRRSGERRDRFPKNKPPVPSIEEILGAHLACLLERVVFAVLTFYAFSIGRRPQGSESRVTAERRRWMSVRELQRGFD